MNRLFESVTLAHRGAAVPARDLQRHERQGPKGLLLKIVGVIGFEPTTSWSRTKRSSAIV